MQCLRKIGHRLRSQVVRPMATARSPRCSGAGALFLLCVFSLTSPATKCTAQELPPGQEMPEELQKAAKAAEALRPDPDETYDDHVSRSEHITLAFAALTGEAVNPLLGITVRGAWIWWQAPSAQRPQLPWYVQPRIWVPMLIIMLLMLFKGTICEALPGAKKFLDALGDLVSKAGAVFSLPIVLAMFADSFSEPLGEELQVAWAWLSPAAHAAEAAAGAAPSGFFGFLGWVVSLTLGLIVYVTVWLAFNTIDVLILICPFPAIDALLKSFRIAVFGALLSIREIDATAGLIASVVLILFSTLIAGWSLRLSVFGFIYSIDLLLFRSEPVKADNPSVKAFSNTGLTSLVPIRTYGTITRNEEAKLVFTYRPWLVFTKRTIVLEEPAAAYAAGIGLINPYIVKPGSDDEFTTMLRLPPRFSGHEQEIAAGLGLQGVKDTSIVRGIRVGLQYLWALIAGEDYRITPPAGGSTS